MSLCLAGNIVPMAREAPAKTFKGRVWIGEDGVIAAITPAGTKGPEALKKAPVIDVGNAWVIPGLIDLHNHLGYNALPLWTEPHQQVAFKHHSSWTVAPTYHEGISWPAWVQVNGAPEALLAYVQLRALVGGTTSIQGWPSANREHLQVVRNIDDEKAGGTDRNRIRTSALTKSTGDLGKMAQAMNGGAGFIYHCAEGQVGSVVAQEYSEADHAGCLKKTFIGIHMNAIAASDWKSWDKGQAGTVVWSPFSNLWLYGSTTNIEAAQERGVRVSLGSDWGPSGTKNILGELKVAKIAAAKLGPTISNDELVAMVTTNPGDALSRCWGRTVGRLVPGAFGDVTVIRKKGTGDVWSQIVAATEKDVALVVYNGIPRYGDQSLMKKVTAVPSSPLTLQGIKRAFAISDPDEPMKAWTWSAISQALEEVRKHPEKSVKKAEHAKRSFAGPRDSSRAPLELVLDMPGGLARMGAARPPDLKHVVIPPLPTLVHDQAFFKDVKGQGFHGGLLDALAKYYV